MQKFDVVQNMLRDLLKAMEKILKDISAFSFEPKTSTFLF